MTDPRGGTLRQRARIWRALILTTTVGLLAAAPAIAQRPPTASVTVHPTVLGRPLPRGFVGLSIEYGTLPSYAGTDPAALDPVFVRLLRGLAPGQAPVLRIGGDSTDGSWWPVPDLARPPGVTYDITRRWLSVARALAQSTGARYILGINLEAGSHAIEMAEAHALLTGIGRRHIAALELGNEPELYSTFAWYDAAGHVPVPGRPPGYDIQAFTGELTSFRDAIAPVPTAGPASGSFAWLTQLGPFLADEPSLRMVTVHSYWLNRCVTSSSLPAYPTVPHLLTPRPPTPLTRSLGTYARLAHAHGVPIRIDEMNSVTCHGKRGVSDVFASALWAINALFEAAADGVDGVNIHTWRGTANKLFDFALVDGRWIAHLRPEYYGLRMFVQAAPAGSTLLRVTRPRGDLQAWATLGTKGVIRLVLINDSLTRGSSVVVRAPTAGRPAKVERLTAPSVVATRGITLGGQVFGANGALTGRRSTSALPATRPHPGGTASYRLTMPPASAAMVTFAR